MLPKGSLRVNESVDGRPRKWSAYWRPQLPQVVNIGITNPIWAETCGEAKCIKTCRGENKRQYMHCCCNRNEWEETNWYSRQSMPRGDEMIVDGEVVCVCGCLLMSEKAQSKRILMLLVRRPKTNWLLSGVVCVEIEAWFWELSKTDKLSKAQYREFAESCDYDVNDKHFESVKDGHV